MAVMFHANALNTTMYQNDVFTAITIQNILLILFDELIDDHFHWFLTFFFIAWSLFVDKLFFVNLTYLHLTQNSYQLRIVNIHLDI